MVTANESSIFDMPFSEVRKLAKVSRGDSLLADDWNQHVEAIETLRGLVQPPQQMIPRRGGGGGGTLAKLCTIVSTNEPADAMEIQLKKRDTNPESDTFGELLDDGEPVTVDVWDEWKAKSFTPFAGRPDVFVAFFLDGRWLVLWMMRLLPIEMPNAVAGDCR